MIKDDLKSLFTKHWEYLAVKTACKTNLFDLIENGNNTIEKICYSDNFNEKVLTALLDALVQTDYLTRNLNQFLLTEKSLLLTDNNPETLKYACLHWGEENLSAWQNLEYTLKTGRPAFENIYKSAFFDYLSKDAERVEKYQKAMNEYARDDYKNICKLHDLSNHHTIADIGGGMGALIEYIAMNCPNTKCFIFEKQEVTKLIRIKNVEIVSGNFFENIPIFADAFILSRIIHDWNDEKALIILQNLHKALNPNGTLYLIENLTNLIEDAAALLTLNMHLITQSFERSYDEYKNLLEKANFIIESSKQLNKLQHLLICSPKK